MIVSVGEGRSLWIGVCVRPPNPHREGGPPGVGEWMATAGEIIQDVTELFWDVARLRWGDLWGNSCPVAVAGTSGASVPVRKWFGVDYVPAGAPVPSPGTSHPSGTLRTATPPPHKQRVGGGGGGSVRCGGARSLVGSQVEPGAAAGGQGLGELLWKYSERGEGADIHAPTTQLQRRIQKRKIPGGVPAGPKQPGGGGGPPGPQRGP